MDIVSLDELNDSNLKFHKSRKNKICIICKNKKSCSDHHIIPRSYGGKNNYDNLVVLCDKCHNKTELFCDECYYLKMKICDRSKFIKCWNNYNLYFKEYKN